MKFGKPLFIFAVFIIAVGLQGLAWNIVDTDGFYHIKHSLVYRQKGIFDSSFPWAAFSVIKELKSDLWYGFHILGIPLTVSGDLVSGLSVGSIVVFTLSGVLFYVTLEKFKIKYPLFWSLAFLFSSHRILLRFSLFRPQSISFGLVMLLFYYLTMRNRRKLELFVLAAILSWVHLNVFWLPLAVLTTVVIFKLILKETPEWRKYFYLLLGLAVGVVMRPNPMGALRLTFINLETIFLAKRGVMPPNLGFELTPLSLANFLLTTWPLVVFWGALVLAVYFGRRKDGTLLPDEKIPFLTSFALAVTFAGLTFFQAARGIDFMLGFGLLAMALYASYIFDRLALQKYVRILAILSLVLVATYSTIGYKNANDEVRLSGGNPFAFKIGSLYLERISNEGDIVFHPNWAQFGGLFFWNSKNYYINGMDPVFEYKYDSKLAWEHYHLFTDENPASICGESVCTAEKREETYKVLKRDFNSKYVVVTSANLHFYHYLASDKRFRRVFEDNNMAIFRVD